MKTNLRSGRVPVKYLYRKVNSEHWESPCISQIQDAIVGRMHHCFMYHLERTNAAFYTMTPTHVICTLSLKIPDVRVNT